MRTYGPNSWIARQFTGALIRRLAYVAFAGVAAVLAKMFF